MEPCFEGSRRCGGGSSREGLNRSLTMETPDGGEEEPRGTKWRGRSLLAGLSGAVRMMNEGRARLHITLLSVWERLLKVLKSAGPCSTRQPRPTQGVERRWGVVKREWGGVRRRGGDAWWWLDTFTCAHHSIQVQKRANILTQQQFLSKQPESCLRCTTKI